MSGRYRNNQKNNRSRFYIILSIVFVFVVIKWGIPGFVNIMAGSGSPRLNQDKDIIPPQSPILSALPEATNSAYLLVEGYTESGAALDILVNDKIATTDTAKEDGSFSTIGNLDLGANRVQVRAADTAGNMSVSEVKIVNFDNKPVEISIISPSDGSEYFGKNNQTIDIKGSVNKSDSQVVINNSFVLIEKDGSFIQRFQLQAGNNEIKAVVSDKAGNSVESKITLVYTP